MAYEHTQSTSYVAAGLLLVAVVLGVFALVIDAPFLLITPGVLALCAVLVHALSSLTTVVTPEAVVVSFRWGRPKRVIPLERVANAEVTRNRWWYGWGIRVIPGATMYNVWGLDAVHLELTEGRDFRIGTDDPTGLAAAIAEHVPASAT